METLMRSDLDKKLIENFPLLYADRHASMMQTCMCWGFECADGWFDLIYKLSSQLEPLIKKYIEEHPDEEYHPRAAQVKEKYGGLRFYMSHATEEMYDLISAAEEESEVTCEFCGSKDDANTEGCGYWMTTRCKKCRKEDVHHWTQQTGTKDEKQPNHISPVQQPVEAVPTSG